MTRLTLVEHRPDGTDVELVHHDYPTRAAALAEQTDTVLGLAGSTRYAVTCVDLPEDTA